MHPHRPVDPLGVETVGHRVHASLVSAAVADEHDIGEAVHRQASDRVLDDLREDLVRERDGTGVAHVT